MCFCFFKQKTAYEMRSSDWSSDVCSSDLLNLRGLGPNRTLVLLNGHRLTPANTGSAPDINMLPQQLIKRVDLVTGGASAAYGSDAVAGVVNFILDEDFSGIKGEVQSGITSRGDGESYKFGGAVGLHLFDNRLHVIASAEYYDRKRSEEHTSELQSLMRISYAVF